MSQTLSYTITVTAEQAHQEVRKLEKDFSATDVAAQKLGSTVGALESKTASTGGTFAKLTNGAKELQQRMAPTAAAISGVSAALGAQAGQLGQTINAAGQVAAAFATGGPLAAALAATVVGVNKLTDSWNDEILAMDKALSMKFAGTDAAAKAARDIERRQEEFRTSRLSEFGQVKDETDRLIAAAKDRADKIDAAIAAHKAKPTAEMLAEQRMAKAALDREMDLADKRIKAVKDKESEAASKRYVDELIAEEKLAEAKKKLAIGKAEEIARETSRIIDKSFSDAVGRGMSAGTTTSISDAMNAKVDRRGFGLGAEVMKQEQERLDWERKFRDQADAEVKKANKLREDEQKTHAKAMADITVSALGAVAEAIAGAASGQKDAWTDLLKYAAKAAGDQITLLGGKTLAEGIASASTPLTAPLAPGQIAAGLGLIAAGQAIAVGGAAAVGALSGQGSASSGARDRGASPSRASGGGEGGGLTVNVSYGVAGPLPEDTARAIAEAMRTGARRGAR